MEIPAALARIIRVLTISFVAIAAWWIYWRLRVLSVHQLINAGTASETIVFRPGLGFLALYGFLAIILLIPPALIFAALMGGDRYSAARGSGQATLSRTRPLIRGVYSVFAIGGLAFSAAIAGYMYEASKTVILLSQKSLEYRTGSHRVTIPLPEVVTMVFRWRPRTQQIVIAGRKASMRIDLDTVPAPDQVLLVKTLSDYAGLTRLPLRDQDSGVIVWRRLGGINPQEQH